MNVGWNEPGVKWMWGEMTWGEMIWGEMNVGWNDTKPLQVLYIIISRKRFWLDKPVGRSRLKRGEHFQVWGRSAQCWWSGGTWGRLGSGQLGSVWFAQRDGLSARTGSSPTCLPSASPSPRTHAPPSRTSAQTSLCQGERCSETTKHQVWAKAPHGGVWSYTVHWCTYKPNLLVKNWRE